ncbi:MAG: DUF4174 domain-containing protein, partial [Luteolibacter sp.]
VGRLGLGKDFGTTNLTNLTNLVFCCDFSTAGARSLGFVESGVLRDGSASRPYRGLGLLGALESAAPCGMLVWVDIGGMKFWVLILVLGMVNGVMGEKIGDFRWEKRLLVVSGADEGFLAAAKKEKAGVEERDMRVFVLDGEGVEDFPVGKELRGEFVERLSVSGDDGKVWLIGKDGNTVLQWGLEEFSFEKVFAAIDGMPMRRREMREKEE